jgi:predicted hydrolase (HD superfamily)
MRPDRFETLEYKSVKKKLKDKSFAAKVSRDDIALGVSELGVSEEAHVTFCIGALKGITSDLFE